MGLVVDECMHRGGGLGSLGRMCTGGMVGGRHVGFVCDRWNGV